MSMVVTTVEEEILRLRKFRDRGSVMIAIVGYRNAEDVRLCLLALVASEEKDFLVSICENGGLISYETLLSTLSELVDFVDVDSEHMDDYVSLTRCGRLRPYGQPVRIYCAKSNLGYAGGVNVSIRQFVLTREWSALWILNPDTEPQPQSLSALIQRAEEGYDIVASRLVNKITQRVQSYGGQWRWVIASGRSIGMNASKDAIPDVHKLESQMNYASGASLFASRNYVETVGLMDERYFLYCEEVDWCFRGKSLRLGYAHNALVYHSHGTTIGSNTDRKKRSDLSVYLDERNRHLFTRRFFRKRYPLIIFTTLIFTAQYLRKRAAANFLVALSGWFAGLRGEEGLPLRFRRDESAWKGK